jgi:hypothetical protein
MATMSSDLRLIDPNLPDENTTIIANAEFIQERVIVPRQRIVWYLHGWTHGPVLVTDRESIMLFDLGRRQLHTLSLRAEQLPTYVMHQITNIFTEGGKVGVDIHFSPPAAIQPVAAVPGERWLEVLLLAQAHPPTRQRMLGLRD